MRGRRRHSLILAAVSLCWLAASCGGETKRDEDASPSGAGTASGAGSGGDAGASGTSVDVCLLPVDPGECNAYTDRWAYDEATGGCRVFVYGGCGGNENQFDTLEECEARCGGPKFTACSDVSVCILESTACCGVCEPATADDFVAINFVHLEDYRAALACGDVQCGRCPLGDIRTLTVPYFAPACDAGQCRVVDVRATGVTDCEEDADCSLRLGAGCCEGCQDTPMIALSDPARLMDLVCSEDVWCSECEAIIPPGHRAVCDGGQCRVEPF